MTYSDDELITSARRSALTGLLNVVAVRGKEHVEGRRQMIEAFNGVLRAIDRVTREPSESEPTTQDLTLSLPVQLQRRSSVEKAGYMLACLLRGTTQAEDYDVAMAVLVVDAILEAAPEELMRRIADRVAADCPPALPEPHAP